jgi:ankyrin repeat protein
MSEVSPILLARYAEDQERLRELLAAKPQLDVFEAAAVADTERLRELLDESPGRALAWSTDGFTPLHLAAYFGHVDGVRLLLERGADVAEVSRNDLAVQPLNSAAASREAGARVEVARLLLDAGANPNSEVEGGFRPLDAAAANGDDALVTLLRERGGLSGRC